MKYPIEIKTKTIEDACVLKVGVGTNCPMGGDAGHGGRTVFRLTDKGGTAMSVSVNGLPHEYVEQFELVLSGDAEYVSFVNALYFALHHLKNGGSIEYFE